MDDRPQYFVSYRVQMGDKYDNYFLNNSVLTGPKYILSIDLKTWERDLSASENGKVKILFFKRLF